MATGALELCMRRGSMTARARDKQRWWADEKRDKNTMARGGKWNPNTRWSARVGRDQHHPPRLPGNDGVGRLRATKSGLSTSDCVTSDGAHDWSDGGVDWSSVQLNKWVGHGTHLCHWNALPSGAVDWVFWGQSMQIVTHGNPLSTNRESTGN